MTVKNIMRIICEVTSLYLFAILTRRELEGREDVNPPLPLLLREKTFVTPVKLKNFRWNFAGVHKIYRNTFWKKCILWWRHCWLWNFCEAKVDQTIDIFSDLKSIELTISPEVHLEKRWKSEWFQVGYLSSLYFKHWSLKFKRSLVYWILQLILNLDQRFLKRKTTDCH